MQPKRKLINTSEDEAKEYLTKITAVEYWDDDFEWIKDSLIQRIPVLSDLIPVNLHICCSHALSMWYIGQPMAQCVLEVVSLIVALYEAYYEDCLAYILGVKQQTESNKNFIEIARQVAKEFLLYHKNYPQEILEEVFIK